MNLSKPVAKMNMKLGRRYFSTGRRPRFRVWCKCRQCCGIQTITFWLISLLPAQCICLYLLFCKGWSASFSECKRTKSSLESRHWTKRPLHSMEPFLHIFDLFRWGSQQWWGWSSMCQSEGGAHVGAAVGKTEYTIFCLWIVKSNDRT